LVNQEIVETTSLESLGVDSLAGLEILFEIEERVGLRLPTSMISRDMTVAELAESVSRALAEQAA